MMKLAISIVAAVFITGCQTTSGSGASRYPHQDGPGLVQQGGYIVNYNGCSVGQDIYTPGNPKVHYYSKLMGKYIHGALDIDMPIGVPIIAAAPGRVASIDVPPPTSTKSTSGIDIRMTHSFGWIYYVHLSKVEVKRGDSVKRGQLIGWSGNTGAVDKLYPHLHFGIRGHDRDVINGHDLWYRTEAEKSEDPWNITVPLYDPSITYPRGVLTFPVDCVALAEISDALFEKMWEDMECVLDPNCVAKMGRELRSLSKQLLDM